MINFGKWSYASTNKYFSMTRIYFKGYIWTPFVKLNFHKKKSTLTTMRELVDIQGSSGNWNYDEYMHGMYNGMELMLAIQENREPNYKNCPDKWLRDMVTECMDTIAPNESAVDNKTKWVGGDISEDTAFFSAISGSNPRKQSKKSKKRSIYN